jgi:hypothetical protein
MLQEQSFTLQELSFTLQEQSLTLQERSVTLKNKLINAPGTVIHAQKRLINVSGIFDLCSKKNHWTCWNGYVHLGQDRSTIKGHSRTFGDILEEDDFSRELWK